MVVAPAFPILRGEGGERSEPGEGWFGALKDIDKVPLTRIARAGAHAIRPLPASGER